MLDEIFMIALVSVIIYCLQYVSGFIAFLFSPLIVLILIFR
ncbi:hypothetical protein [uncultured Fusobacterium sp.]|nr:hypothetical protein [uncultured Fusobacterium sp.]